MGAPGDRLLLTTLLALIVVVDERALGAESSELREWHAPARRSGDGGALAVQYEVLRCNLEAIGKNDKPSIRAMPQRIASRLPADSTGSGSALRD